MKKPKPSRRNKRRKPTKAELTVRNKRHHPHGVMKGLILLESIPIATCRSVAIRDDLRFDGGPSTGGVGSAGHLCGCCFVRKGLQHTGIDHASDCLINVPYEYQTRWRQGRDDVIALHEKGEAPFDGVQDDYYQMGHTCTLRNIAEILARRESMPLIGVSARV